MRNLFITGMVLLGMVSCVPTNQFREVQGKRDTLQKDRDELFAENEHLTVENTEMKAKIDRVEDIKKKFVEDSIRIHKEMDDCKNSLVALQQKYDDLQENYESLLRGNARETRRLLNELQSTQDELARKEQMLRDMEGNLTDQRQAATRLQAELASRNARLMDMEKMLRQKDSLMNTLKQTVTDALLGFQGQGLSVTQRNGKVYVSLQEKLLFSSGSTVVDPNGEKALKQLASVLANNPDINIMIEGHTDDVPFRKGSSIKDNWDLSVLRATSIVRILLSDAKIDPKRITAAGRGEYLPVDPADTPEARRKNRRTEIILSPNLDELYKILDID